MNPGDIILGLLAALGTYAACRMIWREKITWHDACEHGEPERRNPERDARDGGV